uniref:Zinc finger C2H2 LYAR-type domain-containing protein n=1 Tax=Proboscia inermis TaxID=420281 RepID=A0A7S0CKI2_9STRA|mmetsp:Transcript_52493/g.52850  ORF Transcript_52493/g.52850 Transcript_52493/m.52850 type:complete len:252 (+) Transcript_52493:38-793(+)
MFEDDFRSHTSCVTEAERYEKTVYRGVRKGESGGANSGKKGKRKPQEEWNALLHIATTSAPLKIKHLMEQLCELDNVPRKEKQFRNFTINSLGLRGQDGIVGEVWAHLSKVRDIEKSARLQENPCVIVPTAPMDTLVVEQNCTTLSQSQEEHPICNNDIQELPTNGFTPNKDVVKQIKTALKKASGKTMKMKKLRKALKDNRLINDVIAAEMKTKKTSGSQKKILKQLLQRSIETSNRFKVDGDIITYDSK